MQYEQTEITLANDYEGPVCATLLRAMPSPNAEYAVLYLHGYVDYFFQDHLAEEFVGQGYDFYGLDLRKYGRSLRPWQRPNYCRSMEEYFAEIDAAITQMMDNGAKGVILLGHSTGGLLASLYAATGQRREYIRALVLNSPFFGFNMPYLMRKVVIPVACMLGRLFPAARKGSEISPLYGPSLHRDFAGEWDFDLHYKPMEGFPLYLAWLNAIREGHRRIKKGLNLPMPVLVMTSARSGYPKTLTEEAFTTDIVLNVKRIWRYCAHLGREVTIEKYDAGIHDLFLSREGTRSAVSEGMFAFLERKIPSL